MREELQVEQLRDLLQILEDKIEEINTTQEQGQLRIAVSDYTSTKRKFEQNSRLSTKGELRVEAVTEVIKISKQFDDRVKEFEQSWSQDVQKIAKEQEEPSQIFNRNESNTSRIRELNATALALQNQTNQAQKKETEKPFLNMSLDAESKVLAEVALDNKNYNNGSIHSMSYEPSNSCRCRVL